MLHIQAVTSETSPVTELTLSDRLIALARDAARAGFQGTAARMVRLAHDVFDEAPGDIRH